MEAFLVSLLIGLVAAAIDVTPMLIRKLDRWFVLSAFVFWLAAGLLIPRVKLVPWPWLSGLIVSVLLVAPLLPLIAKMDRPAVPMVAVTTLVLGTAVGWVSGLLIR
jgi:hypothetical protein